MKKILLLALFLTASALIAQEKEPPPPQTPSKEMGRAAKGRGGEKGFHMQFNMSPEEEQKVIDSFSEETKKALEVLKSSNSRAYDRALRKAQYKKLAMLDMHFPDNGDNAFQQQLESRKQMIELEIQAQALGAQYEKADAAQKAKFRSELQTKLSRLFDMKEAQQKEEVQKLEKRLADLKEKLDVRQKNKSQIIERKMQDYLGEEDYLEW